MGICLKAGLRNADNFRIISQTIFCGRFLASPNRKLSARTRGNAWFLATIAEDKKIRCNRKVSPYFWSRRRGSNPRPQRPERCALPAALRLDFFKFLSIFVSGQTTYFGRLKKRYRSKFSFFAYHYLYSPRNENIIANQYAIVKPFSCL